MHVCVCSNYYILDEADYVPTTIPEARAAVILYNFMSYREKLEAEEVCVCVCVCVPTASGGNTAELRHIQWVLYP